MSPSGRPGNGERGKCFLDRLIDDALAGRTASAIQLRVAIGGVVLYARDAGATAFELDDDALTRHIVPVDAGTRFDLASLTKPLCTASLVAQHIAAGRIALQEPLPTSLPGPDGVTVAHLLAHASGLPAWQPFYGPYAPGAPTSAPPAARNEIREIVAAVRPDAPPGARTVYSDLGFMLLGWGLEELGGAPLHELFRSSIAAPLGLQERLGFRPARAAGPTDLARFAATERCPWRQRLLVGEVHDDNTWVLGGMSGHAGLFGDADAVLTLALELWRAHAARDDAHGVFAGDVLRTMMVPAPFPDPPRAFGWDMPSTDGYSSAGDTFARHAVGHTGFTGTSLWMQPATGLVVVLLTNRVHPTRTTRTGIRALRPAIHGAAVALAAAASA